MSWLLVEQHSLISATLKTASGDLAEPFWFSARTQTRNSSSEWKCLRPMILFEFVCSWLSFPFLQKKTDKKKMMVFFFICESAGPQSQCYRLEYYFVKRVFARRSLPVQAVVCRDWVFLTWRPFTFDILRTGSRITWSTAAWRRGRRRGTWSTGRVGVITIISQSSRN